MPRTLRISTALLLLTFAFLTCGTASAFPLGPRTASADRHVAGLGAFVEWVEALFSWGRHRTVPSHFHPKGSFTIDPNGGH
jgi:hypothetical protein